MKYGWTIGYKTTSGAMAYVMPSLGQPFWFNSASEALDALEKNQYIKAFKEKYPYKQLQIV